LKVSVAFSLPKVGRASQILMVAQGHWVKHMPFYWRFIINVPVPCIIYKTYQKSSLLLSPSIRCLRWGDYIGIQQDLWRETTRIPTLLHTRCWLLQFSLFNTTPARDSRGDRQKVGKNAVLVSRSASAMQTWGENKGLCPLGRMGPHLTQRDQGRGLPACQVSFWSIQPFGHNTPTLQTDRQNSTEQNRHDNGPIT